MEARFRISGGKVLRRQPRNQIETLLSTFGLSLLDYLCEGDFAFGMNSSQSGLGLLHNVMNISVRDSARCACVLIHACIVMTHRCSAMADLRRVFARIQRLRYLWLGFFGRAWRDALD